MTASPPPGTAGALAQLDAEVRGCLACPRLVAWRRAVAAPGARGRRPGEYASSGIPGFGDPTARLLVVGLAPAAHGANRTGRMFTGDRSGDVLVAALARAGFANQPESRSAADGLVLTGAYLSAPVRCAPPQNRPLPSERAACAPFLARELALLSEVRVVLALGAYALDALWRLGTAAGAAGARPRFSHGAELPLAPRCSGATDRTLLCSYHPSQRNVFTGRLTPAMLDAVIERARELCA